MEALDQEGEFITLVCDEVAKALISLRTPPTHDMRAEDVEGVYRLIGDLSAILHVATATEKTIADRLANMADIVKGSRALIAAMVAKEQAR